MRRSVKCNCSASGTNSIISLAANSRSGNRTFFFSKHSCKLNIRHSIPDCCHCCFAAATISRICTLLVIWSIALLESLLLIFINIPIIKVCHWGIRNSNSSTHCNDLSPMICSVEDQLLYVFILCEIALKPW